MARREVIGMLGGRTLDKEGRLDGEVLGSKKESLPERTAGGGGP